MRERLLRYVTEWSMLNDWEVVCLTADNVIIRKATHQDIEAIVDLWAESATFHGELDSRLKMRLEQRQYVGEFQQKQVGVDDALLIVATKSEEVIGYLFARAIKTIPVQAVPIIGFVNDLAVTTHYRHQGIGTRLFETALEWFKTKKITRIQTTAAAKNPLAKRFWRKMGFTNIIHRLNLDLS